jgi:competence protein ComFC
MRIKQIYNNFINILFPKDITCMFCNEDLEKENDGYFTCNNCKQILPFNLNYCNKCGKPLKENESCSDCLHKKYYFTRALSPFIYKNPVNYAIQNLKYNGKKYLATCFASYLKDCYLKLDCNVDIIIPVPLNEKRFKERGFNQAELLSDALSLKIFVPVYKNVVIRNRYTTTQTALDIVGREDNVKGAFTVINKKSIKDKSILIVDDVYTTGATTNELSKVLKLAGAKNIFVLCVASVYVEQKHTQD